MVSGDRILSDYGLVASQSSLLLRLLLQLQLQLLLPRVLLFRKHDVSTSLLIGCKHQSSPTDQSDLWYWIATKRCLALRKSDLARAPQF